WAEGRYDRLPALANELVDRQAAVIVTTGGSQPARAVLAATSTIPLVFTSGSDPVAEGPPEIGACRALRPSPRHRRHRRAVIGTTLSSAALPLTSPST